MHVLLSVIATCSWKSEQGSIPEWLNLAAIGVLLS